MRLFNYWYLSLFFLLSLGSQSCASSTNPNDLKEDEKLIEFTTDRFTLPNLHVTPDGENIIFDVLGDIYQVPIEGGKAEVVLQDNNWKRAGKLSPDGRTLAYVSDETGEFQVWSYDLETEYKQVYPIKESVHYPLYAYWDAKGELLIPSKVGLQSYNVFTGASTIIRPTMKDEESVLHAENKNVSISKSGDCAFIQKDGDLWCYDINKQIDLFIGETPDKSYMEFFKGASNGEKLLFYKKNKRDYSSQDLVYWDLRTNDFKTLNTTNILGTSTTLNYSFDFINNHTIVLDKEGEIVQMNIETRKYTPIPIKVDIKKKIKKPLSREPQYIKDSLITATVLRNPVTKPELDTIYFGAFAKLHSYAKSTEEIMELYSDKDQFEQSPSLSPDGKYLAYTTWNDTEMGHVYARELETGKEYQLTQTPGLYINPAWSPDGTEIVFVADETEAKMGIPRQSGGRNTYNYHVDLHLIKVSKDETIQEFLQSDTIYTAYPFSIMPRRFYPIPVYHPNGKGVFITTRNLEKDLPVLIQIDLNTKELIQETLIPYHTDEVLISPDAKNIAFIFDEQVWIDTYPYSTKLEFSDASEFMDESYHYKGGVVNNILLSKAKSVYEVAPSYLSWQDKHTLMWGSAEEVYTYHVYTGVTEKIAEVKVLKPRAVPKAEYALTNARVITVNKNDEIIEKGTILVKNNRIQEVGKIEEVEIPIHYKVFDLEGKTIIPGLIDVHAHYLLEPYEIINQQNYKFIGNLAYGVTTIYDPSVNVLDYREQAQMVEAGVIIGPRVFASGNIIMNHPSNYDFKKLNSIDDGNRILKSMRKLEVYGPIKEYDNRNRKKRKMLRSASKKYNIMITAHQNSFIESMCRIIDGFTAIEHEIGGFGLKDDIIKFIGKSGLNYTPTFIVSPLIGDLFLKETDIEVDKLKEINGETLYQNNYAQYRFNLDSVRQKLRNKSLIINKKNIKRAANTINRIEKHGGVLSIGGHGNPLPGIGTHWEIWAFTYDNGLSNYQSLKAATLNGAEKLDLQKEIGSIEKGKLADLVVLNSNPLENIFYTTDIYYTIQNGGVYE